MVIVVRVRHNIDRMYRCFCPFLLVSLPYLCFAKLAVDGRFAFSLAFPGSVLSNWDLVFVLPTAMIFSSDFEQLPPAATATEDSIGNLGQAFSFGIRPWCSWMPLFAFVFASECWCRKVQKVRCYGKSVENSE